VLLRRVVAERRRRSDEQHEDDERCGAHTSPTSPFGTATLRVDRLQSSRRRLSQRAELAAVVVVGDLAGAMIELELLSAESARSRRSTT